MSVDQHLLELSDYTDHIGETFVFSIENVEEKPHGVLVKAESSKSGKAAGIDRESFSLQFRFPPEANIGQAVFHLETAGGMQFPPLFLVPRAADEEGWFMHAVIN